MQEQKNYLVTFAKGAPQEASYPVEATSKNAAKEAFSRQYLGRYDATFMRLLSVVEDTSVEQ